MPLRLIRLPQGTIGRFRELRPGLVIGLDQSLTEEVVQLLASPVKTERIRVLSIFDASDVDTVKRLAEAAGDRLVDGRTVIEAAGKVTLREAEGTIVIAVGHVEDGSFVARSAAGGVSYRVPIAQLEAAADEAGVTLLSAGCSCFTVGARGGFLGPVSDVGVAASIPNVLAARSYADLLAAFGQAEAPFAINNSAVAKLAEERVLELDRLARHQGKVHAATVSLRLMNARPGQTAFRLIGPWLLVAGPSFLLMFRMNRAAYLRLFPVSPAPQLSPVLALALRSMREILFFLVGPVISLIVLISFVFGFWSVREQAHEFLWSALFKPLEFCVGAVLGTSFIVLWFGTLMAFVAPAFMIVADVAFSYDPYPTILTVLLTGAAIPYALAGWWMVKRFPDRFAGWLAAKDWSLPMRLITVIAVATLLPMSILMAGMLAGELTNLARHWSSSAAAEGPFEDACADPLLAPVCKEGVVAPANRR